MLNFVDERQSPDRGFAVSRINFASSFKFVFHFVSSRAMVNLVIQFVQDLETGTGL